MTTERAIEVLSKYRKAMGNSYTLVEDLREALDKAIEVMTKVENKD